MNIKQLMSQAQNMQKQMQEMQEKVAKTNVEGRAGGGMVVIKARGDWSLEKVQIDPSLLKEEEKEMLEDLIVAAFSDLKQKIEELSKDNMSGALSGMKGMFPGL